MLPFYDINAKLRYIKFCLLLFTFLLVLTGIALIIIGSTINAIYAEYSYFLQIEYFSPATSLVFIGFAIFGVALVGLYGTLKTNSFVIGAYGGLLGAICVLQLGAGLACYLMSGDLVLSMRTVMNETVYEYPNDDQATERMDMVQETLSCCGMDSAKDWNEVYPNPEIPRSCCAIGEGEVTCEYFHNRGCYGVLVSIIADTSRIFTTSASVLAFMQLTGMAFAFYMANCLRQQLRAKRERKLLVTEQLLYSDAEGTKSAGEHS